MAYTRRTILQATALGCGVAALPVVGDATDSQMLYQFSGPGLYLYPHWGDAQRYIVTPSAARTATLEFRDPATHRLLWQQTLSLTAGFAARLM